MSTAQWVARRRATPSKASGSWCWWLPVRAGWGGGGRAAGPLFVVIPRWSFCWGTRSAPRWGRASVRQRRGFVGPWGLARPTEGLEASGERDPSGCGAAQRGAEGAVAACGGLWRPGGAGRGTGWSLWNGWEVSVVGGDLRGLWRGSGSGGWWGCEDLKRLRCGPQCFMEATRGCRASWELWRSWRAVGCRRLWRLWVGCEEGVLQGGWWQRAHSLCCPSCPQLPLSPRAGALVPVLG